jgi:hypothetical protein
MGRNFEETLCTAGGASFVRSDRAICWSRIASPCNHFFHELRRGALATGGETGVRLVNSRLNDTLYAYSLSDLPAGSKPTMMPGRANRFAAACAAKGE